MPLLLLRSAPVALEPGKSRNYIENFGLTRKHQGDGKYEHVKPRHSWNAAPHERAGSSELHQRGVKVAVANTSRVVALAVFDNVKMTLRQ